MAVEIKTGTVTSQDITSQVTVLAAWQNSGSSYHSMGINLWFSGLGASPGAIEIEIGWNEAGGTDYALKTFTLTKNGTAYDCWNCPEDYLFTSTSKIQIKVLSSDAADSSVDVIYHLVSKNTAADVLLVGGAAPQNFQTALAGLVASGNIAEAIMLAAFGRRP